MSSFVFGGAVPMKTELLHLSTSRSCGLGNGIHFMCSQLNRQTDQRPRGDIRLQCISETVEFHLKEKGAGGDGGGNDRPFHGGGGDGGGDHDGDGGKAKAASIMKVDEVFRELKARGAVLPADMLDAAKVSGLPRSIFENYLNLEGSGWLVRFLMRHCSMVRDRMLEDASFLFKLRTEVTAGIFCATVAEVQKRGKDFWAEFDLYAADLLVGIVVDAALVALLAPYARIGKQSPPSGFIGQLLHTCGSLPSSVFEADKPGISFSLQQRIASYFYMGTLYGAVGFGFGIIGQSIANMIMNAKRGSRKSEDDVPVPPLFKSALLWGAFLAVSSNTRYQIINGLEGLVSASAVVRRTPDVAKAFTYAIRYANSIYGGMQFVDWARWSGVQ